MLLKTISRELINLNFRAARLPVSVYERVARRGDEAGTWPVAAAFDSAEASIKQTLGSVFRDEQLLTDARLQRAKVTQLREAMQQKAAAARTKAEAEARFEQRTTEAERQKERLEQQAQQREQELAREKAQAKQRVAEEAARKKQAAQKAAAARQQQIAADERAAELRRVQAEAEAVAEKERALNAEEQVTQLDAAAKATKRVRTAK